VSLTATASTYSNIYDDWGIGTCYGRATSGTSASTIWKDYDTRTSCNYKKVSINWGSGSSASTSCAIEYGIYSNTATNDCKWITIKNFDYNPPQITPECKMKLIIKSRQGPLIISNERKPLPTAKDTREICARQTLRRVIGDKEFKEYMKNGFVSVKAKSGLVYQIYPKSEITRVYKDGTMVERLCVVMKGDFPPTDSLIMRYLLILNDEDNFRKHAINHAIIKPHRSIPTVDSRSLVEIFRELKL
jgi:hypothetical protein